MADKRGIEYIDYKHCWEDLQKLLDKVNKFTDSVKINKLQDQMDEIEENNGYRL